MITKAQKKLNNKILAINLGSQLADIRHQKKILLADIPIKFNYDANSLDIIECGLKLPPLIEIIHIASFYNKKVIISFVDA